MSVTLSPMAPRYAVSDADDPFKKYWWAILMGIVFTAVWLLTPMLGEKSVGSTAIDTTKPKVGANVEQALVQDAGDGLNLSMDGTGHKRKEDPLFGSSLYQAPEEAPAAAATAGTAALGSASGSTLAGALKKVSESSGWAEKAQKGFDAPKLSGGSMSGMSAASGGRSGSAGGGTSAFGSSNAQTGYASTKGLSGGADIDAAPNSKGIAALKAASAQALLAASSRSGDDARSSLDKAFDGAKGGSKIGGKGGAALGGGYAALDTAPVNLKLADPKLNEKKIAPPPGVDAGGDGGMKDSDLAKQIAMTVAAAAIGAAVGGVAGGIVTQVVMQAIQRQEDQANKARELEQKQKMDRAGRKMGAQPSTAE